jgi:hypothetical protein
VTATAFDLAGHEHFMHKEIHEQPAVLGDTLRTFASPNDHRISLPELPVDNVLGVGQAAVSLIRATSRRRVATLLDLGAGNGVQALHATRHADAVTATDVSPRAIALARATFGLNQLDVELLRGEWFDPVARRRFDQIVCNPPFVVGPPRIDYVYRDSGLAGDDASAMVVRRLPEFLAVSLLCAASGVPVAPHAGDMGQLHQHLVPLGQKMLRQVVADLAAASNDDVHDYSRPPRLGS